MPTSTGQNWGFTSQTYTPYAQADIMSAMRRAEDVSQLPFQPYLGQTVAGFSPSELAAMRGIYGMQGYYEPYGQQAAQLLGQAQAYADPYRYNMYSLNRYYNPYQQNVINTTMANIAQENLRQQNDLTSRAIQQGAFGGDRTGIARAELNRLQNLQNAQTLAGLQAQGFQQAQQQYNQQQQAAIEAAQQGAYSLGQLGLQGQQAGMQGIQALMGVGQMERALGQAQLEDQFKRYMTAQGYPWETTQWLASIVGALGPQAGGTTTGAQIGGSSQSTPGASPLSAIAGLATSGLGGLLKLFPGAGAMGAKDGGRIEKADGGGFGDIQSLGLENPWSGFDPRRLNEEKMRQWLSRQDVDDAVKSQLKDRGWLNPDENLYPYKSDEIDYSQDDGGPTLMSHGGRAGYKDGGHPYSGGFSYIEGDTVPYIDKLQLPSPKAPHIPEAGKMNIPEVGSSSEAGGLGDIGKMIGSLSGSVSKYLSKGKSNPAAAITADEENREPETSSEETSSEQYGGRVNKADGGGFANWLSSLSAANPYQTPTAPYLPQPQQAPTPKISSLGDLYQYAFGRAADPEGLSYWQQQQTGGMSLSDIAKAFASSSEAKSRYGETNLGNFGDILQQGLLPFSETSKPYQTLITTGGAPVVNPNGTPVTLADVQTPSAVQGQPTQGPYSEGDIAAAGQISGPNPAMLMAVGQNPMLAILINQQQQQKQEEANRKVAEMRAHNAAIYNAPRSPIGYFMNLDYGAMSPSGLFGFNPISPYYSPIVPTGVARKDGGKVEEQHKGFQFGGYAHPAGQLPSTMTGPGSQTSPSSFQTGYNPSAFSQQRAEGGRTGMADGGYAGSFYNSVYNAVYEAAKRQGAPHPEVLAKLGASQAALETEWGKHAPGNNYFGIKGPGSTYATKEVVDGKTIGTRASFRGYPSMQASANDYVRLMASSPRYRNVYRADTPEKAFAAQGSSGYATDPRYGSKLARISEIGSGSPLSIASRSPAPMHERIAMAKVRPLTGEHATRGLNVVPATRSAGPSFFNRLVKEFSPVSSAQASEAPSSTLSRINPSDPSGPLLPVRGNIGPEMPVSETSEKPMFAKPKFAIPDLAMPDLKWPGLNPHPLSASEEKGFGPIVSENRKGITGPNDKMFTTPEPGLFGGFEQGLKLPRMMLGDTPESQTFAGAPSDYNPETMPKGVPQNYPDQPEERPVVSEEAKPEPKKGLGDMAGKGPFYGDWRDYEPWKSDPIGKFIDEMTGDVPHSKTMGKSAEVGGGDGLGFLEELFKGRASGGRLGYEDGGSPEDENTLNIDPELLSPEPMGPSKGFDLAEEPAPEKDVVSRDEAPAPRRAPAAQKPSEGGLGGLLGMDRGRVDSLADAMIAAGFGMMAGHSPNAWQNIGMGGLKGIEAYQAGEAIRARREGELAKIRQKELEAERGRSYLKEFLGAPSAEAAPARPMAKEEVPAADLDNLYNELERYQSAIAGAPDAETERRLKLMQDNIKFRIQRIERSQETAGKLAEQKQKAFKESPEGIVQAKTAEDLAKQEIEMGQLGKKATDTLSNLSTMKTLLEDPSVHTGPLEEAGLRRTRQIASQYVPELVKKLSPMDISKESVAKTGDLIARANTMVKDALGGSLGAGVSNADVRFLQNANVSLENTPEENKRIVDTAIRVAKLNQTLAREAENYKESHGGHLDFGWNSYRDKIQEKFYSDMPSNVVSGGGASGTTKSGLKWSVK